MDFVNVNCCLTCHCVCAGQLVGTMPSRTDECTHVCIQQALQGPGGEKGGK